MCMHVCNSITSMQWVCRTLLHSSWHSQARGEDGSSSSPRRPDVFMGGGVRARRLLGKCWHQLEKHRRKYWSAPHLHNNSLRCVETHRTNVSSELKSKELHWHVILTYALFNETDSNQYTRHFGAGCKGHVEGQRQDHVEAHYLLLYFNLSNVYFFCYSLMKCLFVWCSFDHVNIFDHLYFMGCSG